MRSLFQMPTTRMLLILAFSVDFGGGLLHDLAAWALVNLTYICSLNILIHIANHVIFDALSWQNVVGLVDVVL
jgi:hypothetical protein